MFYQPISTDSGWKATVSLAEVLAAFSFALDLTEGQPAGHAVRSCWIAMQIGKSIGLNEAELHDLYYTTLLKDLGCSSNAARICELYEADDLAFKRGYKTIGTSLAATLHFVFEKTARGSSFGNRAARLGSMVVNGNKTANELILSRCTRGAEIAADLRFSPAVCEGIYRLDEHWDGSGRPGRLSGRAIPLYARLALLGQIADVFHRHAGPQAARDEVPRRAGTWLDPELANAFRKLAAHDGFWATLACPYLEARLVRLAPPAPAMPVYDGYLDAIARAFGQVIDAKSPYTAGHSERVAKLSRSLGSNLNVPAVRQGWLARAAALHDIGKLGVSNTILDKPAALDAAEWKEMREHAGHTREILGRIGALADLADVAAAHHERLDGKGYPLGLEAAEIGRDTRIITTCDFYDALTSHRPYRAAMPSSEALAIMRAEVGGALDADCVAALEAVTINGQE